MASAVNDTTREIGTALGIAIMGSMFNSGYRRGLSGHLSGVPADAAAQARQAPGLAFDAAHRLGHAGDGLAAAARDAFSSGMRFSMLMGAGLLVLAATYVALGGPSRVDEITDDAVDATAGAPASGPDADVDPPVDPSEPTGRDGSDELVGCTAVVR